MIRHSICSGTLLSARSADKSNRPSTLYQSIRQVLGVPTDLPERLHEQNLVRGKRAEDYSGNSYSRLHRISQFFP